MKSLHLYVYWNEFSKCFTVTACKNPLLPLYNSGRLTLNYVLPLCHSVLYLCLASPPPPIFSTICVLLFLFFIPRPLSLSGGVQYPAERGSAKNISQIRLTSSSQRNVNSIALDEDVESFITYYPTTAQS